MQIVFVVLFLVALIGMVVAKASRRHKALIGGDEGGRETVAGRENGLPEECTIEGEVLTFSGSALPEDLDAYLKNVTVRKLVLTGKIWKLTGTVLRRLEDLEEIILPEGLEFIDGAFAYCFRLRRIEIPESVRYVSDYSFNNCDELRAVVIHGKMTEIADLAFVCCPKALFYCHPNSVAERHFIQHGISFSPVGTEVQQEEFEKRPISLNEIKALELKYFSYSGLGEYIFYTFETGTLTYRNIVTPEAYGGKKYPDGYFDEKTVTLDERKRGLCRKTLNELKVLPYEEKLDLLPPGAYHEAMLRLFLKDGTERCYSNTHVSSNVFSLNCEVVKNAFLNVYEFFLCFCDFPKMEFGISIPEAEQPILPPETDCAFFAETLWMCSNCRTLNRFCDSRCIKCGKRRAGADVEEPNEEKIPRPDMATGVMGNSVPETTAEENVRTENNGPFVDESDRFTEDIPGKTEQKRSLLPNAYREEGKPYNLERRLAIQKERFEQQSAEEHKCYEDRCSKRLPCLNKIRGSLYGGAVGDALGYPVEFASLDTIRSVYGPRGIESYRLNPLKKIALISDDTQMTLFTASGIIAGHTRGCMRGIEGDPCGYVYKAYLDWLTTQKQEPSADYTVQISGLVDIPELWDRRAPGNTCLRALSEGCGSVDAPINSSKGCGGVMRVAPMGLDIAKAPIEYMVRQGAEIAAITHGHSLGYMPAAMLVHIVRRAVYGGCVYGDTLRAIVREAIEAVSKMFSQDQHLPVLVDIMEKAVKLADNDASDEENIRHLGQGWVAEEALAIAVYCSLRYEKDFSAGIIAAVNHDGDSDSTGAITGNILGAHLGYEAIEDKWKRDLELSDLILEMADDLCFGCPMEEYGMLEDPVWEVKYRRIGTKLNFERFEEE